jgi:hypothetical protein
MPEDRAASTPPSPQPCDAEAEAAEAGDGSIVPGSKSRDGLSTGGARLNHKDAAPPWRLRRSLKSRMRCG